MKKIISLLLCLLLILPISVNAAKSKDNDETVKEEEKEEVVNTDDLVKVYIFLANDCSYCEAELEYLEGLDSYNKKFTIVKKELFSTIHPAVYGSDYELGQKVVKVFNEAGFRDANTNGTPLVIISDIYARTSYSTDLESYIDRAYEEGDKDVVACVEDGKDDCIKVEKKKMSKTAIIILVVSIVVVTGAVGALGIFLSKKQED